MDSFVLSRGQDAYAAIRGFVYQVDLTILRWIDLGTGQTLELERGEDIDLVTQALSADEAECDRLLEQVKHRESPLTLRDPAALEALANALDHRATNPTLSLLFRYTTNARIGTEKPSPLPDKVPLIELWEAVRQDGQASFSPDEFIEVLRSFVKPLDRPEKIPEAKWKRLVDFFSTATVGDVLSVVRTFEWATGSTAAKGMADQVKRRLLDRGLVGDGADAEHRYQSLFLYLFKLLATPGIKRLTPEALQEQLAQPTLPDEDRALLQRVTGRVERLELRVGTIERTLNALGDRVEVLASDDDYHPADPAVLLRMPSPAAYFVGREADVTALAGAMIAHRVVSVEGPGGIGKTQLLLQALARLTDGPPVVWISVEKYSSVSEVRLALSRALSRPRCRVLPGDVTAALSEADVRVVFDGVERLGAREWDDLEDFFRALLAETAAPRFAFTSQVELSGIDVGSRVRVGPLDDDASHRILRLGLEPENSDADHGAIAWLVDFCAGHALSLRLAAGLLRYFKSAPTVVERLQRIGSAILRNPTRQRQTSETSLRACLLVSYQALTDEQRRVLWLAANSPAGCLLHMLDGHSSFGIADLAEDVAALRRWYLVDQVADPWDHPRLHVLSPIRSFVADEWNAHPPPGADDLRHELVVNMVIQANAINSQRMEGGDAAFGVIRFDYEFPNHLRAFGLAVERQESERFAELVGAMAHNLMTYCFVRGLFAQGVRMMRLGADSAVRLKKPRAASHLLLRMMCLAARSDDDFVVRSAAKDLVRLASVNNDPSLQGDAALARGHVALVERRWADAGREFAMAAGAYERELERITSAGGSPAEEEDSDREETLRHYLSIAYKDQGFAFEQAGNPAEAARFYERSLALIYEGKDEINEGGVLHALANCAADLGDYERASDFYLRAANCFQPIAMAEFLSNSLAELADVLCAWTPSKAVDEIIPRHLLEDGLTDMAAQVMRVFVGAYSPLPPRFLPTLRKAFRMMALTSYTSHTDLLADWAAGLGKDVLMPLMQELDQGIRSVQDVMPLMHLHLTLAIAKDVSCIQQPGGVGPQATDPEIERYAWLCYQFEEPGFRHFHPFEWLSMYLSRHRGMLHLSSEVLLDAAIVAAEGGGFSLPSSKEG